MRYSVIAKGMPISQIETNCRMVGAHAIKAMPIVEQVFCDMEPEQAARLASVPGLTVKPLRGVKAASLVSPPVAPPAVPFAVGALSTGLNLYTSFSTLWNMFKPPLLGQGLTVAVLDTGIRETHVALEGKVIKSANFSESPSYIDIFDHGTQVAHLIAGNHEGHSGTAPGAKLINVKVLNDNGEGTDEAVVDGIDYVCSLVSSAKAKGYRPTDEEYPNSLNMSLGMDDDGDRDNPVRVACRVAYRDYELQLIAAAGNSGPDLSTILCPACDPVVVAIGGIDVWEFDVWEKSSRGPTAEGLTKPDLVCWAEEIEGASGKNDNDYVSKSGTSFSAPILSGVHGLLWELTRRAYGETVALTWYDVLEYAPFYCIKPEGTPIEKDNQYGYGLPAIGNIVQRLQRGAAGALDVESLMGMMMAMMMMGMIGKIS